MRRFHETTNRAWTEVLGTFPAVRPQANAVACLRNLATARDLAGASRGSSPAAA